MKKCKPETGTIEHDSLHNKRVNEIDELYISPESREYCRELSREIHEQTAKFVQKVIDDPKTDLSNCPWPFGLIILERRKKKKPGEAKYTQLYGPDRTTRELKIPDDISAVHTFLALYRDERLGGDRIVTYEIRDICQCIAVNPLIKLNTAEMLERQIPALIRCAREDLKAKGLLKPVDDETSINKKKIKAIESHGTKRTPISMRIKKLLRKLIK